MSAVGTNRTNRTGLTMSVLEGKADFPVCPLGLLSLTPNGHWVAASRVDCLPIVFTLNLTLAGKRLELLHEIVPSSLKFGFSEGLFITHPAQPVQLADRHSIPVIYADDKPVKSGGLISYGADQDEGYRLLGVYAARVLKGEKPMNMPVQQSTKTRLVINLKAAKTLGLTIPTPLLGRAEDIVE